MKVGEQRSWRPTSVGINNPDKRLRNKVSGNHLNKYWGYWKNRESFPLSQIWSKYESEPRWKVNIVSESAWAFFLHPNIRHLIHLLCKAQFCPPSVLCHQIFSAWDSILVASKPNSLYPNENTKHETHQSKPKYSFDVSIHTNSKTTDKRNEIIRNGKNIFSFWEDKERSIN